MEHIKTLKLAVFEANAENLISDAKRDEMLSFCESADMNSPEDLVTFSEMVDELISIAEGSVVNENTLEQNIKEIKLTIFESAAKGDITDEERDDLLAMLQK